MEITAAFEAVKSLPGALEVVSDSTYVVNCFRDRWWEGWLAKGWRNSQRKPVANRDLWEPFVELVRGRGDVTFRWVKGHSGDPMNDLVDRLAVEAAASQEPRSGNGRPEGLGPADVAGRSAGTGTAVAPEPGIDGRVLVVFGHRAADLGGYDDNPTADAVRARLADIIRAKADLEPGLVVVSGLGLGAEILGAEAALEVGVPLAVGARLPGAAVGLAGGEPRPVRGPGRPGRAGRGAAEARDPSSKQQAAPRWRAVTPG